MGGIAAQCRQLGRGEAADGIVEIEPGPGDVLRMLADVVAAKEIAGTEQGDEDEPAREPSDYPRQRPSNRSRVTG